MKITVTAGHSDSEPGAIQNGAVEHELMTELRDIIAMKLREAGHQVKTDGERWRNLPLVHAMTLVPGSDCAIELHTNSSTDPRATGVEVVSLPTQKRQAQKLAKAIADCLGLRLRGEAGWLDQAKTHRGRLGFVRVGGMVVEVFFLSNLGDLASYQARKWLVASAIASAITEG